MTEPHIPDLSHRVEKYVHQLPPSQMTFLYFTKPSSGPLVPIINTVCKKLRLPHISDEDLYIVKNSGSDGFCYIYRESAIKYSVFMDDNTVVAYEKAQGQYAHMEGGGNNVISNASWGDHLTIGLIKSYKTRRVLLAAHETNYLQLEDFPNNAQGFRKECNTYFQETFNDNAMCIVGGDAALYKVRDMFKKSYMIPLISHFKEIYAGTKRSGGGASGAYDGYHLQNGKKYKIHRGSRGGQYIVVNRQKRYLQMGGMDEFLSQNRSSFSEEFVEFLRVHALQPFADTQRELTHILVFYENGASGVMIRYCFGDTDMSMSTTFFVEKEFIHRAYFYHKMTEMEKSLLSENERNIQEATLEAFKQVFHVPVTAVA